MTNDDFTAFSDPDWRLPVNAEGRANVVRQHTFLGCPFDQITEVQRYREGLIQWSKDYDVSLELIAYSLENELARGNTRARLIGEEIEKGREAIDNIIRAR